jgi:Ca-activated chloride channel family protein
LRVCALDAAGAAWETTLRAAASSNRALSTVWARGLLRQLEDRYAIAPAERLAKQIVETSLAHGVLCRFTAFVAIDDAETVNPGGVRRRLLQPVEAPSGWQMLARSSVKRAMAGRPPSSGAVFMADLSVASPSFPSAPDEDAADALATFQSDALRKLEAEPARTPAEAHDLAARAERIATLLETEGPFGRRTNEAIIQLERLLAETHKLHIAASATWELEAYCSGLKKSLARTFVANEELERIVAKTVALLRQFAEELSRKQVGGKAASRRKRFWT